MKATKHKTHKSRFLVDFMAKLLGKRLCNCIYCFDTFFGADGSGQCPQRDFFNGGFTVAGTYGEPVFICKYCYLSDKKEIDEWSKGRRDFVKNVQINEPALWEASTRHRDLIGEGR